VNIAFLFPGQGSQNEGFLHRLPAHAAVAQTLEEAHGLLGRSVLELDSASALRSTIAVQLSLYTAGVAVARALIAENIQPQGVAGLSVGAFAAAVICGSVRFQDGWILVKQRAEAMEKLYPSGYGLGVIVGLRERDVRELVERNNTPESPVYMGNINAPLQMGIAGSVAGMEKVIAAARKHHARKAELLNVSVPSHCTLLSSVARELEKTLTSMPLQAPAIPYISNRRARPLRKADLIREDLATNIEYPVRWHDATSVLEELGTDLFLEMPPGHVLTTLAHDAFPDKKALAVEDSSIDTIARRMA